MYILREVQSFKIFFDGWIMDENKMNLLSVTRSRAVGKKAGKICEAKIYFIFEILGDHESQHMWQFELV